LAEMGNMSWGEYSYRSFFRVSNGVDLDGSPLPAWSKLSDQKQLEFEEHARKLTAHVSAKYFGDDEDQARRAFDMGKGNLDIADEMLGG
jgi:hypothetical protein